MSTLTLYIIRQMIAPLLIVTITLSGLIWMLRALRLLDNIIISGQSLTAWLELLLYTAPTVLILTIPPAFLIATLYSFYRLFMDNEIAVMFSIGLSRVRLIRPVMLLAGLTAIIVLLLGFYAVPWSNRVLKIRTIQIDTDIASAMLRPGIFTNPASGITAFIRGRDEKGFLHGIFIQDGRNPNNPVSYIAESGALARIGNHAELIMFNGHIQHYDRKAQNSGITTVKFDRYSYDLSLLTKTRKAAPPSWDELYPDQMLARYNETKLTVREKKDVHERLLKPIYVIVYALLALAAFLPAQINRQSYARRIVAVVLAALAMRLAGIYMIDFTAGFSPQGAAATYAVPVGMAALALFVIARGVGPMERLRHRIASARS